MITATAAACGVVLLYRTLLQGADTIVTAIEEATP